MGADSGGIRHELAAQVAAIAWPAAPNRIAGELGRIRATASRHGLLPAVAVAKVLEAALARGERGVFIREGLHLLSEAVASERQDEMAGRAFAAACAIHLAT